MSILVAACVDDDIQRFSKMTLRGIRTGNTEPCGCVFFLLVELCRAASKRSLIKVVASLVVPSIPSVALFESDDKCIKVMTDSLRPFFGRRLFVSLLMCDWFAGW